MLTCDERESVQPCALEPCGGGFVFVDLVDHVALLYFAIARCVTRNGHPVTFQ